MFDSMMIDYVTICRYFFFLFSSSKEVTNMNSDNIILGWSESVLDTKSTFRFLDLAFLFSIALCFSQDGQSL
jgi:hypothetical protein